MADGSAQVTMKADTDDVLIALAKAGDTRAFRTLAARYYETIRRFAWRCCGDATDAEDIAQEALIRIARGLDRFEGRSSFSTWAYGVVLNAARDRRRAEARRARTLRDASWLVPPEAAEDDEAELEAMWAAVDELPEAQREAVLLVHVEGLSHAEAAKALGCAEATVSWRLFTARRRLKAALGRAAT